MFSRQGFQWCNFRQHAMRRLAVIQDGGQNSSLVRKRLYFWFYAGQQQNFEGYLYISEVLQLEHGQHVYKLPTSA